MRILFFSHIFLPAIDGGSQLIYKLIQDYKEKGNEVLVLTSDGYSTDDFINPRAEKTKWGISRIRRIRLIRIRTIRKLRLFFRFLEKFSPLQYIDILKYLFSLLQTGPVFLSLPIRFFKKWKPEVIIAGVFPTTVPVYGYLLAKILKAKFVLVPCFHIDDKNFYRWPLIPVLKRADKIMALTNFEKEFYVEKFGIDEKKIQIYRYEIRDTGYGIWGKKEPMILFLGAKAAHKRVEFLIDAFIKLVSSNENCRLVLAGKETLYSLVLRKKIEHLSKKIKNKIKYLGEVSERKKYQLIDECRVLVNPSIHESLGLVFFEAWARKKPVIAANLPVLKEVIRDKIDGLLFEKDNVEDLVDKIKKVIRDKRYARKLGMNGYKKVNGLTG